MIEICKFTPEEIEEAVCGLDGLSRILPKQFMRLNVDGQGKEDAEQVRKHLNMGKHALLLLADAMEKMKES